MNRIQLARHIQEKKSYLCVGLDTNPDLLPFHMQGKKDAVVEFNKAIIDATAQFCVAYKINTAFYEARGAKGWEDMARTVDYIPETHFKIADAKRGDIGNTSSQYAKAFFETIPFDAITVAPYMGEDSIRPFLEYEDKWTIVLGLTSNKGSADFQQQFLATHGVHPSQYDYLYERVIKKVCSWGTPDNLMLVIGATKPGEMKKIRDLVPEHFFLVPGVGFQGGSLEQVSEYGMNAQTGILINVSRAIIYASHKENFAEEAKIIASQYHYEMSSFLGKNDSL